MPLTTARTVAAVLARLGRLGLEVAGIRAVGPDAVELNVVAAPWTSAPAELIGQAWSIADARFQVRRSPAGLVARVEVQPGIWLAWNEQPSARYPTAEQTMRAFGVGPASEDSLDEVVMAASPDEAAAYYADGWGLGKGELVAVAWDPAPAGTRAAQREHRLFRVLADGRVARLSG